MTDPTGGLGFTPPRSKRALSRRRMIIEIIATLSLTVSLVIAAAAVSIGNRVLTRDDAIGRPSASGPVGALIDKTDGWFALRAAD